MTLLDIPKNVKRWLCNLFYSVESTDSCKLSELILYVFSIFHSMDLSINLLLDQKHLWLCQILQWQDIFSVKVHFLMTRYKLIFPVLQTLLIQTLFEGKFIKCSLDGGISHCSPYHNNKISWLVLKVLLSRYSECVAIQNAFSCRSEYSLFFFCLSEFSLIRITMIIAGSPC